MQLCPLDGRGVKFPLSHLLLGPEQCQSVPVSVSAGTQNGRLLKPELKLFLCNDFQPVTSLFSGPHIRAPLIV